MTQKSNNTILILVVLVLFFPLWIGLAGGLISILAGVFGIAIGLIAGLFGIIVSIFVGIVSVFTWSFHDNDGFFYIDGESVFWMLVLFSLGLALLFRRLKNKRAATKT